MKILKFILSILIVMSFNSCENRIDSDPAIKLKTYSVQSLETKSTTEPIYWETGDNVTVYSVDKDGVITWRSDPIVQNISNDGKYADIIAEIDTRALHYYAHYPSGSCPLNIGDIYEPIYIEPSIVEAPRLHDLPQIGQANGNTIHFDAQVSCFRLYEIRKSKLPINVKILDENGELIHSTTISKNDADLSKHFTRKSLLGISEYYDYCWNIPYNKIYTIKVQIHPNTIWQRQYSSTQEGKRGVIYGFNVWGD